MRMDKLTSRFQQALADAQSLALGRDHQFLEPAHVMLALLDGAGGSVRPLLLKAGADVNKLRAGLLALLEGLPKVEGTPGDIHVSNDLNRVLNVTDKLAQQRGDQFISSELFVLAAFEDRALARLFKEEKDPITVLKWKEVYENLENATDRCEDVANIIEGVVLEHA